MFIDQKNHAASGEGDKMPLGNYPVDDHNNKKYVYISFFVFSLLLLVAIVGMYFVFNKKNKSDSQQIQPVEETTPATSTQDLIGGLPGDISNGDNNGENDEIFFSDLKAEDLTFGYFYEPEQDDFKAQFADYKLPLNVKTDVSNYRVIARKVNLDNYLTSLNANGFAIIKNDKPKEITDFYSASRQLADEGIPLVLSSDFILYYYQNNLKGIYKEIESTTFFDNIWDVSNGMYQMALVRYKNRKEQVGLANDSMLEAARLECAYFATALRLMSPTKEQLQVSGKEDASLFEEEDAQKYYFELPDFLNDDVNKEVELIKTAKGLVKSPLFLYERDYGDFSVPSEYNSSAKLKNYYLTLKWLNSLFPQNYKDTSCSDCLLDYDDWKINVIAANLIAEDLYSHQDLKNKWAIVYKFIAFFTGLRQDLTYLHYRQAFISIFGEDKKVSDVFSTPRSDGEYNQLRAELAKLNFQDIEGGIERNQDTKKIIGLRLLQESYWPNDYIFSKLAGPDLKPLGKVKDVITLNKSAYRSSGFSYDIVNLIYPGKLEIDSNYYLVNTNYTNYDKYLSDLRDEIDKFNKNSWNNNVFWITLDMGRLLLSFAKDQFPAYAASSNWLAEKSINTFLGSWVDINLPGEKIYDYYSQNNAGLGSYPECNTLSYVEPNIKLVNEIIAKNKMLIKMLNALNITKKNNIASVELINLNSKFEQLLAISKKELSGQAIDDVDCNFINDFMIRSAVGANNRSFVISTKSVGAKEKKINESISNIKYLGLLYKKDDKIILGLGPIFNFQESMTR